MRIGVPRERKDQEGRAGIAPAGVIQFTAAGHEVLIEAGAGAGSGIGDREYEARGSHAILPRCGAPTRSSSRTCTWPPSRT